MNPNGIHYYDRVATDAGVPVSAVNAYVQANSTGYLNSWVENKTGANLSPDNKETLGWLAYTAGQLTPGLLTVLGKSFGSTGYEALGEGEASLLDEYPGLLDDFDYSVPGEVNAEDWFTMGSDDATFDWTLPKDGSEVGVALEGTGDAVYSPINQGPLSIEDATSYNGATYAKRILTEDTTFYRVYGGKAGKVGSYMSRVPQYGGIQSQLDLALNPDWGNTTDFVSKITVPKGTVIFEGTAAPQLINGGSGVLYGGGNQVYIPKEVLNPLWFGS